MRNEIIEFSKRMVMRLDIGYGSLFSFLFVSFYVLRLFGNLYSVAQTSQEPYM